MRCLLPLFFCLVVVGTLQAQSAWKLNLDTWVFNPILSPNGRYLVYYTNKDSVFVECVEVTSGTRIWARPVKNSKNWAITQFIGNDTIMIGEENRYEFLSVRNGSTIASLPIIGESWQDLTWGFESDANYDTLRPWIRDSIGIYYFRDGMQIVDLRKISIIYQTTESIKRVKHYVWENYMMIKPVSGGDTIYIIDFKINQLVYKRSIKNGEPNEEIFQPFLVSNSRILTFDKESIQCVDMATGNVKSVIKINPTEPESFLPVICNSGLLLVVSDKGIQTIYDTETGLIRCKTKPNKVPGIVEQVIELPNEESVLFVYDDKARMSMYKIQTTTGDLLWSRPLFVQDGSYVSGHKQESSIWASIGHFFLTQFAYGARNQSAAGRFGYRSSDGFGFDVTRDMLRGDYFQRKQEEREANQRAAKEFREAIQHANDVYSSWINPKKSSDGYATLLSSDSTTIMVAAAGKIYTPATADKARTFDGEGIFTVQVSDGMVIESIRCPMLAYAGSQKVNAVTDLNIQKLDSARVLIGSNDLYVVRNGGIEHLSFGGEAVTFLNSSRSAVNIRSDHYELYYDYWRIDVSTTPARKYLIARSYTTNIVFHDTATVFTTLRVGKEAIESFPLIFGDVSDSSFTQRKWVITEDEMDSMNIGYLDGRDVKWNSRLHGIWIDSANVFLMGSRRVGYVSSDGSCRWSDPWSPMDLGTKLGLTKYGKSIVYSTGSETVVINPTCPMKVVGLSKIPIQDTELLVSKDTYAIIVDKRHGIIEGYPVK